MLVFSFPIMPKNFFYLFFHHHISIFTLFTAALDCPKWLDDSCGSRGLCLRDPYQTHMRDCKCMKGHYYDLPPGYCVGKDPIENVKVVL